MELQQACDVIRNMIQKNEPFRTYQFKTRENECRAIRHFLPQSLSRPDKVGKKGGNRVVKAIAATEVSTDKEI